MTLVEWLTERRRRGIGGTSSDPFHKQLARYGDADYDALLAAATEKGREAGLVYWVLCQRPPQNHHQSLWFYYGGHAKKAVLGRLAGSELDRNELWKLLFLPLDELRVALRSPVLEAVVRRVSGDHFIPVEELIAGEAGGEDGGPTGEKPPTF